MKRVTLIPRLEHVLAATSIVLWCSAGFGQSEPGWDGDGGHDSDYGDITRLEWRGPGAPGTFLDYQLRRGRRPFEDQHVYTSGPSNARVRATRAMVLVNTALYPNVQAEVDRYVADLVADGYTVDLHQMSGGTDVDLKNFLFANATDLEGVVLVGDQVAAWYEDENWGHDEFPADLYFMDLDGAWVDADGDGIWDAHNPGSGDVGPEIHVGRIDASMMTGDEVTMTRAYFDKNHAYRTGGYFPTNHALTYTEDDWAQHMDMRTDVQFAYESFTDIPAPATNRDDYLNNQIPDPAFEFIQLACHSWSKGHSFTRGGNAYSHEVQSAPPMAVFYNLFCCSSLRFTDSDFLGGAYIYDTGTPSLTVIGSTKTGSMLNFWAFYQPLGDQESFGEAYRQWFNTIAPYSAEEISWHYGMTVAGDPFLFIGLDFIKIENVTELGDTQDEVNPRPVLADVTVPFHPPVTNPELHYRVGGTGAFTAVPMTLAGGDTYTADIPPVASPARVSYYVRAEDSAGHAETFPAGAPDELLSYRVGEITIYYQDGFETDTGWTHGMDANQDDWQRSADHGLSGSNGEAGDPPNAYEGINIWGNDLGPGNWNGEYQNNTSNWLRSPMIDLSGATGSTLSFARWLNVEKGIYDQAQVKVNGEIVWENPLNSDLTDTAWHLMEIDISQYDGNPAVQLEFRLITDEGLTYGGWNIDDVRILSLGPVGGCGTSSYCTAKVSSTGQLPVIGSTGTPSVGSGDFEITLSDAIAGNAAIYIYGDDPHDAPFWGGTLCVHAPQTRGPVRLIDGAATASWAIDVTPELVGTMRHYQIWFRDPGDPVTVGLTGGLVVRFCD